MDRLPTRMEKLRCRTNGTFLRKSEPGMLTLPLSWRQPLRTTNKKPLCYLLLEKVSVAVLS